MITGEPLFTALSIAYFQPAVLSVGLFGLIILVSWTAYCCPVN